MRPVDFCAVDGDVPSVVDALVEDEPERRAVGLHGALDVGCVVRLDGDHRRRGGRGRGVEVGRSKHQPVDVDAAVEADGGRDLVASRRERQRRLAWRDR